MLISGTSHTAPCSELSSLRSYRSAWWRNTLFSPRRVLINMTTYEKLHLRWIVVRCLPSASNFTALVWRPLPASIGGTLCPLFCFHLRHDRGVWVLSQTDTIVFALEGVHVKQLHIGVIFRGHVATEIDRRC